MTDARLDMQEHARVAERAVAAIAGNGAVVDMDDLGRATGAVGGAAPSGIVIL